MYVRQTALAIQDYMDTLAHIARTDLADEDLEETQERILSLATIVSAQAQGLEDDAMLDAKQLDTHTEYGVIKDTGLNIFGEEELL